MKTSLNLILGIAVLATLERSCPMPSAALPFLSDCGRSLRSVRIPLIVARIPLREIGEAEGMIQSIRLRSSLSASLGRVRVSRRHLIRPEQDQSGPDAQNDEPLLFAP